MISCYVDITSVLQPKAEQKESANTQSCTVLKRFLLALTVLEKSLHNFTLTSTKELVEKPKEVSVITLEWTENPPGMSFCSSFGCFILCKNRSKEKPTESLN